MITAIAFGLFAGKASLAPIRIACVGASVTFGIGTPNPATQSYPAQLQRILGDGYEVKKFARSGTAVTKNSDNPYWNAPEFKASKDYLPQIVLIGLGGNDARPVIWLKVRNNFVPDLKELVAVYRNLPSHPKVFLCLPPPTFLDSGANIEFGAVPLMKQTGREIGAPVIDLFAVLEGRVDLMNDKEHPNEVGAGMMAVAVAEAIEDPVEKKKTWKLVSADSEEAGEGPARMAIDGDSYTFWHTNYSEKETKHPHEIVVDMGREEKITAFRHLPRQDGGVNGRVRAYEVYFSKDGVEWGEPVLKGEIKNVGGWSMLPLATAVTARFFKFRALSEWHNGPWTSVGEFDIRRAIGF